MIKQGLTQALLSVEAELMDERTWLENVVTQVTCPGQQHVQCGNSSSMQMGVNIHTNIAVTTGPAQQDSDYHADTAMNAGAQRQAIDVGVDASIAKMARLEQRDGASERT